MTWQPIKNAVQNQSFTLVTDQMRQEILKAGGILVGPYAGNGTALVPHQPGGIGYNFQYLGAGTNKLAFRVVGTNWVLCLGKTGHQVEAHTFQTEIDTLLRLGRNGVRVPAPFETNIQTANVLFQVNVVGDEEVTVPAFIMQFMPTGARFREVPKNPPMARRNFMSINAMNGSMARPTTRQTFDDLNVIHGEMAQRPWGDFQVMYDRMNGQVIVFDPLDTDPNQQQYLATLDGWIDDLEPAIYPRNARLFRTGAGRPLATNRRHGKALRLAGPAL